MSEVYVWIRSLWLLWLFLVFVAGVAWIYWPKRRDELERHGQIPFKDDGEPLP
ncbi:MAG TPA: cbb3-type cytochrome c oxidase subunit 3 [Geminicoccus sp.]|jgi:cbb3-type cytochrome oxidase subunit 3|uniref:cbb3-type cytochrome oxidase subunit 3 n=1 Tax=Geminicoccus sp. TaxID=2024832 RepID=UPI002E34543E|nr:cbb3-type cytochrome c oxidase subunit 3 [Geminicoccus sp.]HEX2525012.1 cbb3-type cytochrome c oxidase subunit 3 [Geminicoccus sp.]